MAGDFLLDSNFVIALLAEEPDAMQRLRAGVSAFVPAIVLGELYFGAQKSQRVEDNVARVDEFAAGNTVLVCDTATAQHYGRVKDKLRQKGRPIPDNDIWIASVALQYGLVLLTRDEHFTEVDDLQVEGW